MKNYALTPKIGWMIRKKDVEQIGLQQKYEYDLKTKDRITIRVKEIPEAVFALREIKKLEIQFIDNVIIPDRLANIKIQKLNIGGKINHSEYARIRQLFPDTEITINYMNIDVLLKEGNAINSPEQSLLNALSKRGDDIHSPEVSSSASSQSTVVNKKVKKTTTTRRGEAEKDGNPLIIIDGKKRSNRNNINAENIASFNVLKGQEAIKKYGKKGKKGVIIITTK
jgi:hypothetical protein